eukprot:jgi/Pico_ML_1/53545/g4076.t1
MKESRWKTYFRRDVVGDYDYKFLCMPHNPFGKKHQNPPPFFAHDEKLSLFVAMLMGLQHSLAMLGGVITPPLIIAGQFDGNFTPDKRQYVVAAALLTSGIFTVLTVIRLKLFGSDKLPGGPYYIGTGLLSVMGVSFTFLPIFQSSIRAICGEDGVPGCQVVAIVLNLILPKEAVQDEEGGVKTYQLPSNVISRVEEPEPQKEALDSPPDSENGRMRM